MGTTVVALALLPEEPTTASADATAPQPLIANVGDSRGYLFRDGSLTQLTEDHSVVADLVRDGRITAEEAEVHPQRNIVTRVLGMYETVEVDLWPVDPILQRPLPALLRRPVQRGGHRPDRQRAPAPGRPERGRRRARAPRQRAAAGATTSPSVVVDVVDDGGVAERGLGGPRGRRLRPRVGRRAGGGDRRPGRLHHRACRWTHRRSRPRTPSSPSHRRRSRRARNAGPPSGPRTRLTWRVLLFVLLVLGRDRRRGRHHPVVRHQHLLRGLRRRRGRDLPGPARRRPVDRPELEERTGVDRADVPGALRPAPRRRRRAADARQGSAAGRQHRGRRSTTPPTTTTTTSTTSTTHDQHDRGLDHHPGQLMLRAVRRNTELGLIVLGTLVTVGAYVLASLAEDATIPANIGPFLGDRARAPARRPHRRPAPGPRRRRHAPADRRAAQRPRLRVHRPPRRGQGRPEEPRRPAVRVGRGRHRRLHRARSCSSAGCATSSATAGRSACSASACSCSPSCPASAGSTSAPGSG